MAWLELRITTRRERAAGHEVALEEAGALSVTLEDAADQPIYEPALGETPLWQSTRVQGLFDADVDTEAVAASLGLQAPEHWQWQVVEDRDWCREWMDGYQPIECGPGLWVCPSWLSPPDPSATTVLLDPGLAFGTGTHPTTRMCLGWLARTEVHDRSVIDFGCGSGILGVAAALRGAKRVHGFDIDPQALLATRENMDRNGIPASAFSVALPPPPEGLQSEVVLANILAGPLVELAETLISLVAPGGLICLSGILAEQAQVVRSAYEQSIDFDPPRQEEQWVCLSGRKRPG